MAQVSKPGAAKVPATPAAEPGRKILFTLRDSRPSRVEITGSFNNWTPAPFVKGENHVWEITLTLIPGEYAYNFLVDGKAIRDPNNPRTAPEGRSLRVVKAR
jgi:plastocyanin